MPDTYVLHHAHCSDGFGAAWAAWKALGDAAEYIPVAHGNPPPEMDPGSTVYILDFSYPRRVLEKLRREHARVVVIDHHETAMADLAGLPDATFDLDHSGAVLAWTHFRPDEPVPEVLRYVEDRDLWRFALPTSHEINAAIQSEPQTFARWDRLNVHALAVDGVAILRHQQAQVERILATARFGVVGRYLVPTINTAVYVDEACHALITERPFLPFVGAWHIDGRGRRKWSLRSGEHGIDVGEVALALGGGGHKHASGFVDALPKVDAP